MLNAVWAGELSAAWRSKATDRAKRGQASRIIRAFTGAGRGEVDEQGGRADSWLILVVGIISELLPDAKVARSFSRTGKIGETGIVCQTGNSRWFTLLASFNRSREPISCSRHLDRVSQKVLIMQSKTGGAGGPIKQAGVFVAILPIRLRGLKALSKRLTQPISPITLDFSQHHAKHN